MSSKYFQNIQEASFLFTPWCMNIAFFTFQNNDGDIKNITKSSEKTILGWTVALNMIFYQLLMKFMLTTVTWKNI